MSLNMNEIVIISDKSEEYLLVINMYIVYTTVVVIFLV